MPARLRGEGGFLNELSPEVVAVLAEYQLSKPAPEGSMLVQPLGGAVARAGARTTPLGGRDAPWAYQAGAAWFDPGADAAVSELAAGLRAALAPYAPGDAWPNFIPEHDPTRLRAAYGAETWRRLQSVRASWDPTTCSRPATRSPSSASVAAGVSGGLWKRYETLGLRAVAVPDAGGRPELPTVRLEDS